MSKRFIAAVSAIPLTTIGVLSAVVAKDHTSNYVRINDRQPDFAQGHRGVTSC